MKTSKKGKKSFIAKLKDKYRLVLMKDDTFEEKLSFRLSRMNVFVFFGTLVIFLVVATSYIIAFTPLKEYIPGYADFDTRKILRDLMLRTDSLEKEVIRRDLYIYNFRNIIEGKEVVEKMPEEMPKMNYEINELPRSKEDSMLRAEMDMENDLMFAEPMEVNQGTTIYNAFFFPPVKGVITNYFNAAEQHFGIDIVAGQNEAIKATLDGTVIYAGWTLTTGYTIAIQHANNILSVYKHNSILVKEEGNIVKAGEVIAIIGNSGTYSSGTHLHFELWYNGNPINPLDFIVF